MLIKKYPHSPYYTLKKLNGIGDKKHLPLLQCDNFHVNRIPHEKESIYVLILHVKYYSFLLM